MMRVYGTYGQALDFTSDLDLVLTMIDSLAEQASASSFDFRYLFEGFEKVRKTTSVLDVSSYSNSSEIFPICTRGF